MVYLFRYFSLLVGLCFFSSFSLVEDVSDHLSAMETGDELLFEYSFEGCYGPYHHGTIHFTAEHDTIHYLEKSFDDKGDQGISQSGKYHREDLLDLLAKSKERNSKEILGNTITYRISRDGVEMTKGADRIEQRHFIEIFHPFSNVFPISKTSVIPGLKTGGFVH